METVPHNEPKICNSLPNECEMLTALNEFKVFIKKWIPENWRCRLCKIISNI